MNEKKQELIETGTKESIEREKSSKGSKKGKKKKRRAHGIILIILTDSMEL